MAGQLGDPLLAFAADILDDLERTRIANENRLRQLTRATADTDGEVRGFGLDASHPDVARLAALVAMLEDAEHQAELNLTGRMRSHPLYGWVRRSKGVGAKQAARLLATLGDPYVRPAITRADGEAEPARPRKVSELWAFAGYHVIQVPATSHIASNSQSDPAGGGAGTPASHDSAAGQDSAAGGGPGPVLVGVAPRRQRGVRANWSPAAKMRAHLVAASCIKQRGGGLRAVYDQARDKYAGAVHATGCVRCGPRGSPAQPGSPLSDGHKHARGLRAVAKQVLLELWREARAIHEDTGLASGHTAAGTHATIAAGQAGSPAPGGHVLDGGHVEAAAGGGDQATASSQEDPGTQGCGAAGGAQATAGGQTCTGTQRTIAAGRDTAATSSPVTSGTHHGRAAGGPDPDGE
jgi:hypothetical protein